MVVQFDATLGLLVLPAGGKPAHVAQLVEHVLGKDEVTGSIPVMGSSLSPRRGRQFRKDAVYFRTTGVSIWQRKHLNATNRT